MRVSPDAPSATLAAHERAPLPVPLVVVAPRRPRRMAAPHSAFVQLSVGGARFESARSTLLRVRGSFFELLLGACDDDDDGGGGGGGRRAFAPPADGVYRVDRSPAAFPHVLEYLRSGVADMSLPDSAWSSAEAMAALGRDAAFYMLDELSDFVLRLCLLKRWSGLLPRDLLSRDGDEGVVDFALVEGGGAADRRVSVRLLRELFPALHALVAEEAARSQWRGAWTTSASLPRMDVMHAVLRFAALKGSAAASWTLPQPAAQHAGFTFVSPARIEVQRLFDGAEEFRLCAAGSGEESAAAAAAAAAGAGAGAAGSRTKGLR